MGIDPFVHCVLGPVNQAGNSEGVPDGHVEPSIVVEHRAALQITASANGNVTFALVPSPFGAIGLDEGTATITINGVDVSGGSEPYSYSGPATVTDTALTQPWGTNLHDHYSLIPFNESLQLAGQNIQLGASGGFQPSKFRVLTVQARVSYTGTSLANSGVAATAKIQIRPTGYVPAPPTAGDNDSAFCFYGAPITQPLPDSFAAIAALAGSRVFPVTESVTIMSPADSFEYQEIRNSWCPYYTTDENVLNEKEDVFAGLMNVTTAHSPDVSAIEAADPIYGYGYAPLAFYAATGLASGQSITVEVRSCIEYNLAFSSPTSRFAKLPPPERPLAIRQVKSLARMLPSSFPTTAQSEVHGWLSQFIAGAGRAVLSAASLGSSFLPGGAAISKLVPMMADMAMGGMARALPSNSRLAIGF